MNETPFESFRNVTVAVAFDDHTRALVDTAVALCRATGKTLCLIHAVEPWASRQVPRTLGANDPLWNATLDVAKDSCAEARSRLQRLAAEVPADVKVTTEVISGDPAECLPAEILRCDTALLLVGARFNQTRLVPSGLSNAIALMQNSPVPVLVIDTKAHQLPIKNLRLLLADDLSEQTAPAVRCAIDFGIATRAVAFQHAYISAIDQVALAAALTSAAAASRATGNLPAAAEDVFAAVSYHYGVELEKRAEPYLNALITGGADYRPRVAAGNVRTALSRMVAEFRPDLLIFGRHAGLHHDPFFFGRLPYRSMLAFKRPVLIVPGPNQGPQA